MKALLIVDVQNDFLPGGALSVKEGDQVIEVINDLQKQFELIVATKDWHPEHHKSFAIEHGRKPGEIIDLMGVSQILWPIHCVQNTWGAEFPKKMHTNRIGKIFYKGIEENVDSYSAFFDNSQIRSTGLDTFLNEQGCRELVIVGLATDYCVKYSVLDACKLGFDVTVCLDGCRGVNLREDDIKNALQEMMKAGAKVC